MSMSIALKRRRMWRPSPKVKLLMQIIGLLLALAVLSIAFPHSAAVQLVDLVGGVYMGRLLFLMRHMQ